ncbi:MAG: GNAT family N-acetyltransferase [Acidimicrobiia bacterium]
MLIRALTFDDLDRWIDMRHQLWPEYEKADLTDEIMHWHRGKTAVFVADADGELVGFSEATMHERAAGCSSSPVGYLEAWWVDEGFRRSGVGAELLTAAEAWAIENGATEMASDTHADNEMSRSVHRATGFIERRPVVRFHKPVAAEVEPPAGPDRSSVVTLREVDEHNVRDIIRLEVAGHQRSMVATNAVSLAQYAVAPKAWTRAVFADDVPVGYVLLYDDVDTPEYFLWRFMIDRRYQGLGFGKRAIELVVDYVRTRPDAAALLTSYVATPGGPGPFYHRLGFVDTGEVDDGELVTSLAL